MCTMCYTIITDLSLLSDCASASYAGEEEENFDENEQEVLQEPRVRISRRKRIWRRIKHAFTCCVCISQLEEWSTGFNCNSYIYYIFDNFECVLACRSVGGACLCVCVCVCARARVCVFVHVHNNIFWIFLFISVIFSYTSDWCALYVCWHHIIKYKIIICSDHYYINKIYYKIIFWPVVYTVEYLVGMWYNLV